jgi:NAD(P)-dependent dehydrogenase (short-subunit alcohol dehydrogenase family)
MGTSERPAYVITGPTSGIGRETALAISAHGTVVLVGRSETKLRAVEAAIAARGGRAVSVVCDVSDVASVRRAATRIVALGLPIAGVLQNAGILPSAPSRSVQGWDLTFATNHVGPFALTEALVPHLADGAQILVVASAIEDPERAPAKLMGMKGGRWVSAEASARGSWLPGGAALPGIDAYATSKQAILAATLAFARTTPRLRFNAVEPGITAGTGLGGNGALAAFVFGQIVTRLPPFRRFRSTPEDSARTITTLLTTPSTDTGTYYDEKGRPMRGSALAHDPAFQDRVVVETRALLATLPA